MQAFLAFGHGFYGGGLLLVLAAVGPKLRQRGQRAINCAGLSSEKRVRACSCSGKQFADFHFALGQGRKQRRQSISFLLKKKLGSVDQPGERGSAQRRLASEDRVNFCACIRSGHEQLEHVSGLVVVAQLPDAVVKRSRAASIASYFRSL